MAAVCELPVRSSEMATQPVSSGNHDWQLANAPTEVIEKSSLKESNAKPTQQAKLSSRGQTLSSVRTYLGLHPDAPIDDEHEDLEHHELLWSRIRLVLREPFAEFFGVFIMVMFGDGSVAQVLLSSNAAGNAGTISTSAPGGSGYGNYQSISWG